MEAYEKVVRCRWLGHRVLYQDDVYFYYFESNDQHGHNVHLAAYEGSLVSKDL